MPKGICCSFHMKMILLKCDEEKKVERKEFIRTFNPKTILFKTVYFFSISNLTLKQKSKQSTITESSSLNQK